MEGENSRLLVQLKLKFHLSTHTSWFQNGQKCPNRTQIDEILLHKHFGFFFQYYEAEISMTCRLGIFDLSDLKFGM